MEITETLRAESRAAWRHWLSENGASKTEIWLILPRRAAGLASVGYVEAVEEALCFGWIDGIQKAYDAESSAQRFTPRKRKSNWSELNKERARRLIEGGLMTDAGRVALCDLDEELSIAPDITAALEADETTFRHFEAFPEFYKRIRIGFIEEVRSKPDVFAARLANFVAKTAKNERFGTLR